MPEILEKASEIVPSSYYDLIARVVPGCVAIAAAGWVFPALAIHPDTAPALLLLVGAGYVIGTWLSSVSTLFLLPLQWIHRLNKYSDRAVWEGIKRRAPDVDGSTVIKMAGESTAAENICVVALLLNLAALWSPVTPFKLRVLAAALPFTVLIAIVRRYMLRVRIDEPVGAPSVMETELSGADLRNILLSEAVLPAALREATKITKAADHGGATQGVVCRGPDVEGNDMNDVQCPDCSLPMEEGFILDQGAPAHPQSSWVKGPPQRSFWFGLKNKPRLEVATFRCEVCGLLKSYARL